MSDDNELCERLRLHAERRQQCSSDMLCQEARDVWNAAARIQSLTAALRESTEALDVLQSEVVNAHGISNPVRMLGQAIIKARAQITANKQLLGDGDGQ